MRSAVCIAGAVTVTAIVASVAAWADDSLVHAIRSGDRESLVALLDRRGVDVDEGRADGSSPLAWAAYMNDERAVDLLLRAGADVDKANEFHGVTPLSLACENASSAIVVKLLENGANPNAAKRTGETPLMACADSGAVAGVKALLENGAHVNARESADDQTALMWASAEGHADIVRLLLERDADPGARSRVVTMPEPYVVEMPLDKSIWGSNYPDTTRWQETGGGFTALHFAAQAGDIECARLLLEAGADIDAPLKEWGTALNITIASGHEDFALFLVEQGADPNATDAWGASALHYALYKGLIIINRWRPVDDEHLGWERDNMPRLVAALLAKGADPGARIRFGYPYQEHPFIARSGDLPPQISPIGATPLHLAAISGDLESMRILAPVSDAAAKTIGGGTTFLFAAGGGVEKRARSSDNAVAAAKLALEIGGGSVNDYLTETVPGGPRPNVEDRRTALHFATYHGWTDLIEFLVAEGADIDAGDRYGMTPLMIALGDPEGRYYRQVGDASYDLRMRRPGPTPGTGDNPEVAELLLALGATPFTGEYRDVSGL